MSEGQKRIPWIKPKISVQTLRSLKEKNDRLALVHILSELLVTVTFGTAAYLMLKGGLIVLGIVTLYFYFIAYSWLTREGAFHELLHGTPFSNKRVNSVFYRIVTFLGWMNGDYVRISHLRHHQVTLHEDLDMDVALSLDFNRLEPLYALTFHVRHFIREFKRLAVSALGIVQGEYDNTILPESNAKARNAVFRTSRITLALHALLLVLFIATGEWLLILMISFGAFFATAPHLLASMTQHVGMTRNVNDWRLCSRSIRLGPVSSYFYWHMEYHIEHHMYPSVPFYRLKDLRTEIAEYLPDRKGLLEAWKDIRNYLERRKSESDYFIPVEGLKDIPK